MRITENIFFYEGDYLKKTGILYPGVGSSNFLIIKGSEQYMIDSGDSRGPHRKRTLRQIDEDGLDMSKTGHVIFSHSHPDHILNAKTLCRQYPMNFIISERAGAFIKQDSDLFEAFYDYPDYILKEVFGVPPWMARIVLKRFFGFGYLRIDNYIKNYQEIDLGILAKVIPFPSHSPDHIGLYFPEEKILYTADLFDLRAADGVIINNARSSLEDAFPDIERVRQLDVDTLIPAHGSIVTGKENISRLLNSLERETNNYFERIIDELSASSVRGISLSLLTKRIFGKSIVYNESSRKNILYNCLVHLQNKGEVDMELKGSRALWFLKK